MRTIVFAAAFATILLGAGFAAADPVGTNYVERSVVYQTAQAQRTVGQLQIPPRLPDVPALPAVPALPPVPEVPAVPALPALPALPSLPSLPALPAPAELAATAQSLVAQKVASVNPLMQQYERLVLHYYDIARKAA